MAVKGKIPPVSAHASGRMQSEDEGQAPFQNVKNNLDQARAAAQVYVAAQSQRVAAIIRTSILYMLLALVAAVIGVTILISAAVLLMSGTANLIAMALGGRQWAGDLITGGAVIFITLLGIYLIVRGIVASARSKTISSFKKI